MLTHSANEPANLRNSGFLASEVLVAVPTLNEERAIEGMLRSLLEGDPELREVSIVVADGGSDDRTWSIVETLTVEFPNIRLVRNPKKLQSAAINLVAETCATPEHKTLIRADAHAHYSANFIRDLAVALRERQATSVVVPMDASGTHGFQQAAAWIVDTKLGSGGAAHRGGQASGWVDHGHHAAFDLAAFRAVSGYDESFSHNEDAELDRRLTMAGGKIWLEASIRVGYFMRRSLGLLAKQYWNYGRGRARTVLKHRMTLKPRQILPVLLLVGLVGSAALALFAPLFLAIPFGYLAALAGVGVWMASRKRSLNGLWSGPALAAIHLPWGAGFLWQVLQSRFAESDAHKALDAKGAEPPRRD